MSDFREIVVNVSRKSSENGRLSRKILIFAKNVCEKSSDDAEQTRKMLDVVLQRREIQ